MRDISKFQDVERALEERIKSANNIKIYTDIYENEQYIRADYKNENKVNLFSLMQTFYTPLDQVFEKIDLYFPNKSFPQIAIFFEVHQYTILLISEDDEGQRQSKKYSCCSVEEMTDFIFKCVSAQIKKRG